MSAHYHICHECDEISKISTPNKPGRYQCPNCGTKLYTYKPGMVEKLYAYNLAALFLFIITNYFPFLSFHAAGNSSHANFATSIYYLFQDEEWMMGTAILMTTIVVPLFRILLYCILFGSIYHGYLPRYATQTAGKTASLGHAGRSLSGHTRLHRQTGQNGNDHPRHFTLGIHADGADNGCFAIHIRSAPGVGAHW